MKETNMEHYRGEIEKIIKGGINFGVVAGKLRTCKICYSEQCEFFSSHCGVKRIKWLMSEYKPEPVLTAREKHFVEFAQEGWLARDSYGELWWHKAKPEKGENCWRNGNVTYSFSGILVFDQHFRFITWEDEKPWSVEELRKLKVQE